MPIEFACEACKKLLRVPDGSGGLSCECPSCHKLLEIPDPAAIKVVGETSTSQGRNHSTLSIACPKCSNELVCAAELLGSRGQCKKCNYIFTISMDGVSASSLATESTGLIFTCPKCEQLFEGKEEMRGRKGKCHACGDVFKIELRTAEVPKVEVPIQKTIQRAPAKQSPSQKDSAGKPTPQTAGPKSQGAGEPIQLACSGCDGVMEVPAAAAGQTTACPYCAQLVHIPAAGSPPAASTRHSPSPAPKPASSPASRRPPTYDAPAYEQTPANSPTAPLENWIDLSDMGSNANPYGPPSYANAPAPSYQASGPRHHASRAPAVYVVPGVFMLLNGVGLLGLLSFHVYRTAMQWNQLQAALNSAAITGFLFVTLAALILGLLQAVLQIVGGTAMIRRAGLTSARVGAIISCLPCIYCLGINLPLGIWATIVCYTGRPDRDFDF